MADRSIVTAAWHYTNAQGLLGIIQNDVLWASSGAFMNDEQELIKGHTLIQSTLVDGTRYSETEKTLLQSLLQMVDDPKRPDFILSASEASDSLTMWRNYGREAVSYAIGLDKNVSLVPLAKPGYEGIEEFPYADDDYYAPFLERAELPDGVVETFLVDDPDRSVFLHNQSWQKVIYSPEEQQAIVREVISNYLEDQRPATQGTRLADLMGLTRMTFKRELSLIKDQGFQDERELRRHYSFVQPRWKFVHYRPSKLGLTPYICLTTKTREADVEGKYGAFDEFETKPHRLPILSIRIGPCRYPELAELALRTMLDEHGYAKTQILHSEIPFR